MTYVEWLRVRGCLKWMSIVLLCGVALLLIGRFAFLNLSPHQVLSAIDIHGKSFAEFEKSSVVTVTKLPDGATRTVIDNQGEGIHVTIDDRGYWGKHVELIERKAPADAEPQKTVSMGDLSFTRIPLENGGSKVIVEGNAPEDLAYYFAIATAVALIAATILGAPFARENDGHLELALTKPMARLPLALQTVGVDLAGIAVVFVMAVVFLIVGHTIFEAPNYFYGPADTPALVLGFLTPIAWYAMLCAATTSMKRTYGVVLGIAWPIALIVRGLADANLGSSALALLVHYVATALSWINPLTYLHLGLAVTINGQPMAAFYSSALPVLTILALVYGVLAIAQWQRVEA